MKVSTWLVILVVVTVSTSFAQLPFDQNKDVQTGPEVGEPIPPFRMKDQTGRWRTLDDIKGPKGAYLVFHRSADW